MNTMDQNSALPFSRLSVSGVTQNLRDCSLFSVDSKLHYHPSAKCPLLANTISKATGVFNRNSILLNDLFNYVNYEFLKPVAFKYLFSVSFHFFQVFLSHT